MLAAACPDHDVLGANAAEPDDTPDWDAEMSIFKSRMMRPNQLEVQRQLAADREVGAVLYCGDGLAIIEGLENDADVGTTVSFVSGATGVLLWRRDDNLCYALVLGGAQNVSVGERVTCRVAGVLQVVDEDEGPSTKTQYDAFKVPAGDALRGRFVDFLGRPVGPDGGVEPGAVPLGAEKKVALLNAAPDMDAREPICAGLPTGIAGIDVLVPLGKGQSLLLTGPSGSGKTALALDMVAAQKDSGVRCVYASIGASPEVLADVRGQLEARGAMGNTTVVAATAGASLGEQYAAICAACAIAERERDAGGDALVVVDDLRAMFDLWARINSEVAALGDAYLLYRGKEGGQMENTALGQKALEGASMDDDEMVEYEGMIVSVAVAQRRKFLSALVQRSAKLHRRNGGGSLALVGVLAGRPAQGMARGDKARAAIRNSKTLSDERKERMLRALDEQEASAAGERGPHPEREVATEVVEELMSITDGQILLEARADEDAPSVVSASGSVSRIGGRAYFRPLERLHTSEVRLDLAQAEDESRFASNQGDPLMVRRRGAAARLRALLAHRAGAPVPPVECVMMMLALRKHLLDRLPAGGERGAWRAAVDRVYRECGADVEEMARTQVMTTKAEARFLHALEEGLPGPPAAP
ncbi:unnamed protein product [Pedinophyceae sp. YPF-701]|nr:unnamed protein product [Pedinophyceae sp. YPF-701]